MVYPQSERTEQANYESLRHFAGKHLTTKKGVFFVSDTAKELTGATSRLGWIPDPSVLGFWPQLRKGGADTYGTSQTSPCCSRFSQEALAYLSGLHGQC